MTRVSLTQLTIDLTRLHKFTIALVSAMTYDAPFLPAGRPPHATFRTRRTPSSAITTSTPNVTTDIRISA
jgi:hypothetical protein